MKKTFVIKTVMVAAVVGAGSARLASAALQFKLTTGGFTTTITDNGAGDNNPLVGQIAFAGSVGNFSTVITSGVSNVPGSANGAFLQTQNISIRDSATVGATITISMTDTGFTTPSGPGMVLASSFAGTFLSGNAGENATFQSYVGTANSPFGTSITSGLQSVTLPSGSPLPFAFSTPDRNASFTAPSIYSISEVTTISLSANGQANLAGTSVVTPAAGAAVPEPASLSLVGMGLFLLAARRRRA